MAWHQTRKTRRLFAQGVVSDGRSCRICGRGVRPGLPVCNQPRCQRRFADRYGADFDFGGED